MRVWPGGLEDFKLVEIILPPTDVIAIIATLMIVFSIPLPSSYLRSCQFEDPD